MVDVPRRAERTEQIPGASGAPSIGVLYPSGWGNIGDEAILQVTFAALRERWPKVSLRAFTLHPARTTANHGVLAEPLTGVNRHLFGSPVREGPFAVRAARGLARRVSKVPVLGALANRASNAMATVIFETSSLVSAWQWLRTADLVVASGGGQLDAVWGGAWGQPYALARWAWLSRRAGVPFVFLSVGYGQASNWLSRRFLKYAVRSAKYCSVRDAGSREMTIKLGVERDLPVVPDMAFGLQPPARRALKRPGFDIAISPMVYLRPGSWPVEDNDGYRRLVAMWADLVSAVVRRGDRAHLFVSSPGDMPAVHDTWECLDATTRASCTITCPESPDALLEFYRGVEIVIASRLHGVLLAIISRLPVLALSHERKVRVAMQDAGMGEFCVELASASASGVVPLLEGLTEQLGPCGRRLNAYVAAANASLREQDAMMPQLLKSAG